MSDEYPSYGATPTAAVGSQSPILGPSHRNNNEPIFTMKEVMSMVSSITKTAASSAVSAALSASSTPVTMRERGNFYLPPFDPDVRSHDIRDWCDNVDETIATFNIPQQEARMRAILQLRGRANGQVERIMKIIKDNMSVIELSKPWHTAIQDLQLAINCTVSKSTGKSPMEMLFGKKSAPPLVKLLQIDDDEPIEDLVSVRSLCKKRMDERSCQDKQRFDKGKANIKPFKVGDFVLMRRHERHTTKLGSKFEGPMEVLEVLPNDRYKLKHVNLRGCSEKIASHDFLRPAPTAQADPFLDDDAVWAN